VPFLIFLDRIVSIVKGRVLKSPEDNKINESIATGGHEVRPYGMKILHYVVNLESRIVGENYCSPEDNKV
jgi:hypothetical protein